MRIEISHKFVLGFVVVVGLIVFLNYLVPTIGYIPEIGRASCRERVAAPV